MPISGAIKPYIQRTSGALSLGANPPGPEAGQSLHVVP